MGLSRLFVDEVLDHIVRVNCEGNSIFIVAASKESQIPDSPLTQ